MKKRSVSTLLLSAIMMVSLLSACGGNANNTADSGNSGSAGNSSGGVKKDTITALLPPVSANYQARFADMEQEFNTLHPNLTLKIEPASWEDMTQKLDTQVNAGSPPDIAWIGASGLSKYAALSVLIDLNTVLSDEIKADYDEVPMKYFQLGDAQYGLPAYMEIHTIGGNKQFLEEAGIDWKSIQQNGWTYDEFRDAISKGVVKNDSGETTRYGFVFATSGVASKDYLAILAKTAGLPDYFDNDLKYTYTSKKFLGLLTAIREMIDDGSMPKELSSIDAGKRWNMFLTGQTMITGKGLSAFENSARLNNEKIKANDGSAVANSIEVDYISLPVPTFNGADYIPTSIVDGYIALRGKKEPSEEHVKNIALAMNFLSSGSIAANYSNELFLTPITESGRKAEVLEKFPRNEDNVAAGEAMMAKALPARTDIPTDLAAEAIKIETEVIIPKLQALLADEITPQEMYDAVKAAAVKSFGEDGVVVD
ncbi:MULTISPECIES: extracellular solute-binding protein [unclassified Paenibacillus]|uniref:ABC transporter substrate-binding protein n=1 Tax=unclassified Paenibacillus TaxID=185978 RepID=UPI0024061250|nr:MULTISPECIES: extracellular solute-binding protein [unclassified Paenibacillus]MDF9840602.1 multiple sugar transport system substrate-binding protein [Paenibacillus sp. PastF-2]MDF9847184.1 multiple sugar transport system substrate-binding protein [Paenibacillus sp. PastM-2]MDF9853756.1 multiple sugar transport system substrate-binding protein [Paenibacillus sp. PastF-1]MDH6478758.1 multiple sugar transport system substrate-binding protein [Paenibacillus sp. PastH-2]MDH6506490.1 multiple su